MTVCQVVHCAEKQLLLVFVFFLFFLNVCVICVCVLQCQHFKCGQAGGDGASAERSSGREEKPPRTQGHYEIKITITMITSVYSLVNLSV